MIANEDILWDESLAQDRFFGYADKSIVDRVRRAAMQHEFAPEPNPGLFHPDATSSFTQIQFGEANAQLTFHEKDIKTQFPRCQLDACRYPPQQSTKMSNAVAQLGP